MSQEKSCAFCGQPEPFTPICSGASPREARCPSCAATKRSSDLMQVIFKEYGGREHLLSLAIYELQASGPVHELLKDLPGYVCSEYLPDVPRGQTDEHGVRSEDATALTFADNSFDLVISQDVMEHIAKSRQAFLEINRVLKPGGKHIFTIPLHEGKSTRSREGLPPVRHGDPLNPEGALVYWDFGDDLSDLLGLSGMSARLAYSEAFLQPEDICHISDDDDYVRYLRYMARGEKAKFFLYNSNVFIAEKR